MRDAILRESPLELLVARCKLALFRCLMAQDFELCLRRLDFLHLPAAVSSLLVQLTNTDVVHREGRIRLRVLFLELFHTGLRLCEGRNLRIDSVNRRPSLFCVGQELRETGLCFALFSLRCREKFFQFDVSLNVRKLLFNAGELRCVLPELFQFVLNDETVCLEALDIGRDGFKLLVDGLDALFNFCEAFFLRRQLCEPLRGFPQVCNEETLGLQILAAVEARCLFLCGLILSVELLGALLGLLPVGFQFRLGRRQFLFRLHCILQETAFRVLDRAAAGLEHDGPGADMRDLALFYFEPRLYPRGFCILGLEQLHSLLVCCEVLLVLLFQRGEPFACSGEVRRFPLELLVVREGLLIAPTRCLCRKFFGFEAAFLFPLGRERGHNVPQLFFLGLNQGRRSQQFLPPRGKFFVTLAACLDLLALIEESLCIRNLLSANCLRAGVRVLLRNPRAELAGELFRPLLRLLGNVELCLRLAHGLCVDGPV